jgi:Fe(3+) dicitrate transport protein
MSCSTKTRHRAIDLETGLQVDWNLFALKLEIFNNDADFSLQLFGLDANRKSIGYRSNRVSSPDTEGTVRDLIVGDFVNWEPKPVI